MHCLWQPYIPSELVFSPYVTNIRMRAFYSLDKQEIIAFFVNNLYLVHLVFVTYDVKHKYYIYLHA